MGETPPPNREDTEMPKKSTNKKSKGKAFAEALTAKVERVIKANKRKRVKPPYVTPYLLSAVAEALALPAITKAQARDNDAPRVVIDARKVVRTVKPTLWQRPDNAVRARLITLADIDARVAKVGYLRYLATNHPNAQDSKHEDAYKVVLFRTK